MNWQTIKRELKSRETAIQEVVKIKKWQKLSRKQTLSVVLRLWALLGCHVVESVEIEFKFEFEYLK